MADPVARDLGAPILVVGTGALATLFAGRLSAAGYAVCMLGTWANGLRALQAGGARLLEVGGEQRAYAVRATAEPRQCAGARFALVLVKAWQTGRAASQLAACLAPDGLALTLQNGIGNREALESRLGPERVAVGVTTIGATLLGPGLVRAGGEGTISLERHAGLPALVEAFTAAGLSVHTVPDAATLLWGKLVVNAAINPLTALLRVANGELLQRPTATQVMHMLARETAAVAAAQGIRLPFRDAARAVEQVVRRTAANHSSMYQDVRRGAQTEIDAICGAVTRTGERLGVPTPANQVCWRLVAAQGSPAAGR